jgi:acetate CoA/acetoacetate CoA-transferase alpha subunit
LPGEIAVELVPQGTLIERIRAGGFGLGAVVTPTGVGTSVADGKRTIEIKAAPSAGNAAARDFALVNARQADHIGNLAYALTARNFNPVIAMAADVVLAEPQEIVPVGVIPPDAVMTPSVVVTHIIAKETVHG